MPFGRLNLGSLQKCHAFTRARKTLVVSTRRNGAQTKGVKWTLFNVTLNVTLCTESLSPNIGVLPSIESVSYGRFSEKKVHMQVKM